LHTSSPSVDRRIRLEVHSCIKRGVKYFSKVWGLEDEKFSETLQLATRTFTYLIQETPDKPEEEEKTQISDQEGVSKETVKKITDDEKMMILSASGTAVKAMMGEVGIIDDSGYMRIPEVILEFELTPEIEKAVFSTN
jgi:hypothetical protein